MTDPMNTSDEGSRIQWEEIHRNLERARVAMENGHELSEEERKKILKMRAEELAREPAEIDHETVDAVEFLLGDEHYALASSSVREIFPLKDLTPLPCTPPFVAGIINVRGRIVSVVNLKKLFNLPPKGLTNLNCVIILQKDRMEFGLLVDAVSHTTFAPIELQPPLPTFSGLRLKFTLGISKDSVVVLNADEILQDDTLTNLTSKNR